jgi:hypothetical protein
MCKVKFRAFIWSLAVTIILALISWFSYENNGIWQIGVMITLCYIFWTIYEFADWLKERLEDEQEMD